MQLFKGNKVTLKTEDVIIGLISEYFKMRNRIFHLINESASNCVEPKKIISIVKTLPKSLQRSKNRYNQLMLCQQLSELLDYFVSMKEKPMTFRKAELRKKNSKHKPYELFLHFRQVSEIIVNRIKRSLTGSIQELVNNKENYQLFYFINELQHLNVEIENWAKGNDKTMIKDRHQSVEFVYPTHSTFRKTLATTTDASKNLSKHEKHSTFDELNQKSSEQCLLRALTAKMKQRDVKLTTRCPSAATILRNQNFKQPLFEPKKTILKYKHKSTDFQNKTCRNNFESLDKNVIFQSNQNSRFRDGKNIITKERKISILNKSQLKDDQEGLRVKSSKKILLQNQRLKKTGINMLGKGKKQKISNILSSQEISSSNNNGNNSQLESNCEILDPEDIGDQHSSELGSKQIKIESRQNVQSQKSQSSSLQSSSFWENEQNTVYIKERQIYKKARRSGKVLIKDKEDLKDVYMINHGKPKEQVAFSRRRKAMLSTHNQQMTEIQNIINLQNQQKAQKQLEYDENVLLAISDALKTKKNIKQPKQTDRIPKRKHTFNSLFNEMNDFLKNYYIGKPNDEPESVFFEQQKRIRCFEDYNFREKMKQIIKINGNTNVFEIPTIQLNKKDQIYNQIHRCFTFNADSDWIKNVFSPKQTLIQKQL